MSGQAGAVRLSIGQLVTLPPAPQSIAQIVELRRTRVRLYYVALTGLKRQPLVRAADLAARQVEPPLPMDNALDRPIARRGSKVFEISRDSSTKGTNGHE